MAMPRLIISVAFMSASICAQVKSSSVTSGLNEQWFESLHQDRQEIGHWRRDYKTRCDRTAPSVASRRQSSQPCIAGMPATQGNQRRSANLRNLGLANLEVARV
jgi:hypothetical protein